MASTGIRIILNPRWPKDWKERLEQQKIRAYKKE